MKLRVRSNNWTKTVSVVVSMCSEIKAAEPKRISKSRYELSTNSNVKLLNLLIANSQGSSHRSNLLKHRTALGIKTEESCAFVLAPKI